VSEADEAIAADRAAAKPALDLAALGVYNESEAKDSAFARILMLGPPKVGKTTSILTSAPDPLIINCDGDSATKYAAKQGGKFLALDANTRKEWVAARNTAKKLVDAGHVRTVVLDSLTLLADNLVDELGVTLEGHDLWREVLAQVVGGVKRLFALQAHVIVVAHMIHGSEEEGIVPLLAGQAKIKIPAIAHDCVLFDFVAGRKPERQYLVGPQALWSYSGRNVRRSCATDATIPALFAELGIAL
jgi:hypothetical protein